MSKYRLVHYINDNVFYVPVRTIEEAGVIANILFNYDIFINNDNVSASELDVFDENKEEYVKFDSEKFDDPIWYNENVNENKYELNTMAKELSEINNVFA